MTAIIFDVTDVANKFFIGSECASLEKNKIQKPSAASLIHKIWAWCKGTSQQIWRTILFPGADPDIQTLRSVCTKRGGFTHTWKHGAPPVQPEIQESWQAGITRGRLGHYQISFSVSIITLLSAEWITHFLLSSSSNKDKYLTEISTENQLVAIGKSENVSQIKSQCILHLMS